LDLFAKADKINLEDYLYVPLSHHKGLYKCRIVYSQEIERIEFLAYTPPKINSLKLVTSSTIAYQHKWTDRKSLSELYSQKDKSDDILIIKNGYLTDSYYCNIALLKDDKWYTPERPLLKGVQRADLLLSGKILTRLISAENLEQYSHICLFNALNEFGEIILETSQIQS